MAIVKADDGFRLWYEAVGAGPAIIFPARFRAEQAAIGAVLAGTHRVVRYKPRQCVGVMEEDDETGGPWEPTSWTRYPLELDLTDLHLIADAAGVDDFVLAGYSGMGALAGFLGVKSPRVTGLLIGGFPLLAGYDYWLGYVEGAHTVLRQAGLSAKADEQYLGRLLYREWCGRDDTEALAALPGPKILWYGNRDSEPDCRMYDLVGGAAIARRIAAHANELRRVGFDLIEFDGLDHIAALATTEVIAPRLASALTVAGW